MAFALRSRFISFYRNSQVISNAILNSNKIQINPVLGFNTRVVKPSGSYDPDKTIEYEISKNQEEWDCVKRALPPKMIPEPLVKDFYASGWVPQDENAKKLPFYVRRSTNHMSPVYLKKSHRGTKKVTHLKHILGNIWLLEKDLKEYLCRVNKNYIGIRVDEVGGKLVIRGDQVNNVINWLNEKGF